MSDCSVHQSGPLTIAAGGIDTKRAPRAGALSVPLSADDDAISAPNGAAELVVMEDNVSMRQLQLFTHAEIAGWRDRTAARTYSPEAEAFRREHQRHRAWGLTRRHGDRLRRQRYTAAACTPTSTGLEASPTRPSPTPARAAPQRRPASSSPPRRRPPRHPPALTAAHTVTTSKPHQQADDEPATTTTNVTDKEQKPSTHRDDDNPPRAARHPVDTRRHPPRTSPDRRTRGPPRAPIARSRYPIVRLRRVACYAAE